MNKGLAEKPPDFAQKVRLPRYGVEEFARLALHRYSKATLAAPEPGDRFHGYRPLPICFNVSGGF